MDNVAFAYTAGMDEETVERRLREREHGTLSLARDGEAYAVPLAHHYEDGKLYFRLANTPDATKKRFLETTEDATYVVYEATETDDPHGLDSWSVLARGPLTVLDDDALSDAEINDWFAPYRVFDEELSDVSVDIVRMDPESLTGRETSA